MFKTLITDVFLILLVSGCAGSARFVRTDALGGRIALHGAYMPAMAEARLLMVDHCRSRYDATELGDRVEFKCSRAPVGAISSRAVRPVSGAPTRTARAP